MPQPHEREFGDFDDEYGDGGPLGEDAEFDDPDAYDDDEFDEDYDEDD